MERKLETEEKCKDYSAETKSFLEIRKASQNMFEGDECPNFYGNGIAMRHKDDQAKYETDKISLIEEKQTFPEENMNQIGVSDIKSVAKAISKWNTLAKDDASDMRPTTDSAMKVKSLPKALIPGAPNFSSIKEEHIPQREISHKMKNLVNKLGGFKILSPMDTPLLLQKNKDKTDETAIDSNNNEDIANRETLPSVLTNGTNSTISSNAEAAISFDDLPSVEILSNVMIKTRAKISAKRRPQSRQSRKRALENRDKDYDMQC
jgi:hypothetical protein